MTRWYIRNEYTGNELDLHDELETVHGRLICMAFYYAYTWQSACQSRMHITMVIMIMMMMIHMMMMMMMMIHMMMMMMMMMIHMMMMSVQDNLMKMDPPTMAGYMVMLGQREDSVISVNKLSCACVRTDAYVCGHTRLRRGFCNRDEQALFVINKFCF
jgi:hypothetical protein